MDKILKNRRKIHITRTQKSPLFDNLITVDELAQALELSPKTIRNWVARREIPFARIKGRTYFLKDSIDRWIKQKEFNPCL